MGWLSLFTSMPKIAKGESLLLFEEKLWTNFNEYSGSSTSGTNRKVINLSDFYVNILDDPSRYLVISSSINGRIIPVIDCDSEEDYEESQGRLLLNGSHYAAFMSSPKHYWVIPDMSFVSFDIAWEAVCYMPGCDDKYLKFVKQQGCYYIRGELKQNDFLFIPELIHNNCVEPNVSKFVNLLVEHYTDDRVLAIAKLKAKRLKAAGKKKKRTIPSSD